MQVRHPRAHDMGHQAIDLLEKRMGDTDAYMKLSTDELADFWQGMTEACLLRLTRLKPEGVSRPTN